MQGNTGMPPFQSSAPTQPTQSKVLLMGRASAGKTSIRSIIFANYLARETSRLHPTNNVEHCNLRFLGSLQLNLWDCGGQDVFMENYFESQRDHIFRNVHVLIYVLGSTGQMISSAGGNAGANLEVQKDMSYLKSTCESMKQLSPDARVFVFVHKMDLVHEKDRRNVFQHYESQVLQIAGNELQVQCYPTSIWDETLFKVQAWSRIVYSLIPNIDVLERQLAHFCEVCEADEVVLFEKATFVVISSSTRKLMSDAHRFEKISNIVKQFKLSCGKAGSSFKRLTVQNSMFTAFVEKFTHNTCIMVITSDKAVHAANQGAFFEDESVSVLDSAVAEALESFAPLSEHGPELVDGTHNFQERELLHDEQAAVHFGHFAGDRVEMKKPGDGWKLTFGEGEDAGLDMYGGVIEEAGEEMEADANPLTLAKEAAAPADVTASTTPQTTGGGAQLEAAAESAGAGGAPSAPAEQVVAVQEEQVVPSSSSSSAPPSKRKAAVSDGPTPNAGGPDATTKRPPFRGPGVGPTSPGRGATTVTRGPFDKAKRPPVLPHERIQYPKPRRRKLKPDHDHPYLSRGKHHLWQKPNTVSDKGLCWFQTMARERPKSAGSYSSSYAYNHGGAGGSGGEHQAEALSYSHSARPAAVDLLSALPAHGGLSGIATASSLKAAGGSMRIIQSLEFCHIRSVVSGRYLVPFGKLNVRGQLKLPEKGFWGIRGASIAPFPLDETCERAVHLKLNAGMMDDDDEDAAAGVPMMTNKNNWLNRQQMTFVLCFATDRKEPARRNEVKIQFEQWFVREESGVYTLTTLESRATKFLVIVPGTGPSTSQGGDPHVDNIVEQLLRGRSASPRSRSSGQNKGVGPGPYTVTGGAVRAGGGRPPPPIDYDAQPVLEPVGASVGGKVSDAAAGMPIMRIVAEDRTVVVQRWKKKLARLEAELHMETVQCRKAKNQEALLRMQLQKLMACGAAPKL
eukprot:g13379.t1